MRRPIDILLRTLGSAITGAIAGALCGAVLLAVDLFQAAPGNLTREALPYVVIVAYFGAALGTFIGPAIYWSLLRNAPLGRALAWTTVGALGGGAIGLVLAHELSGFNLELAAVGLTALAGAVAAAAVLRARAMVGRTP